MLMRLTFSNDSHSKIQRTDGEQLVALWSFVFLARRCGLISRMKYCYSIPAVVSDKTGILCKQSSPIFQMPRRESENSDSLFITPEAYKATEAVEFIAEHLRNEDQYIQVRWGEEGCRGVKDR